MKRNDLIKTIQQVGGVLERHGGRHDWYPNPVTGAAQPVPGHREIGEPLARRIIRLLSNPAAGSSPAKPAED